MTSSFKIIFGIAFLIIILSTSPALAVCSNNEDGQPGQNGEIEFFTPENVLRYCDDTNWIDMVDTSSTSPYGCPNVGDTCSDGSVYAGLSPDENTAMYTTPADAASTYL